MPSIAELNLSEEFDGFFLCKSKINSQKKNGEAYLKLILADKSSEIAAFIWNPEIGCEPFEIGDVVKVRGKVGDYQGVKQLTLTRIRTAAPAEYNPNDLFRSTEKDKNMMWAHLKRVEEELTNPYLKTLLHNFLGNEEIKNTMLKHPAAKSFHHNYDGGWLEHTEGVLCIAEALQKQYPQANADFVRVGAIFHDIGKLLELLPAPACEYSDQGRLLGHIPIGAMWVSKEIDKIPGFSEEDRMLLLHMILAHHGSLEYASPVVPMTPEAMILFLADYSDSQLKEVTDSIAMDREPGHITAYNRALDRYLYKGEAQ